MKVSKVTENDSKKTCGDCLHCKVSYSPTKINRLCFCAKKNHKEYETEIKWLNRSVCGMFEDMSA
ncbi:MAG: hypothetical protein FWD14_04975 [Treponema sp.]|nr:hypothetical protein [Treponema sp.]